ncbi:ubiquitin-like-specific protease ESD4 [Magnolia sinica]|uniref:ubiquitin-like-specific protease ESD4 n=1 Tax=Magnolia sinica TaxID=86752 RepID=UPI002658408C|nr:ubiquitin-like-specific protease ESD4 [Magnolia sinica]
MDSHRELIEAEDNELRVVRASSDSPLWLISICDLKSWVDFDAIDIYLRCLSVLQEKRPRRSQDCAFIPSIFTQIMEVHLSDLLTYGAGNHKDRQDIIKNAKLNEMLIELIEGRDRSKPLWKYKVLYIPLSARGQHWFLAVVNTKKKDVSVGSKNWEKAWNSKTVSDRPGQDNSDDCGVFMLKYIDFLSNMRKIDFTKEDIPKFRKTIAHDYL